MNTRTVHLAAVYGKMLSAVLAVVATTVFCYCLLNQSGTSPAPGPVPLGPAATAPADNHPAWR